MNSNTHSTHKNEKPKEGLAGLKENWKPDLLSGFLVSLIALPLCLGIAGASNFPPIMGVLTAIVGGIIVSLFAGSALTIKGPAAGLIVIVAGAVEELGSGNNQLGWQLALGCIVIAGILQIGFGRLKVGSLADFFPLSAVHGMLAAIGIIIISKQIHLTAGIAPDELKGKSPVELLGMIPHSLTHFNTDILVIGAISLVIMFGLPFIKNKTVRLIPPAMVVLVVGILLSQLEHFSDHHLDHLKPLVDPGAFTLSFSADFSGISTHTTVFLKYIFLFLLIGSLESVLTVKAIDLLDPYKRKARINQDLTAVGIGNTISGLFGGLPMISEVARSSANINNGGKTKWANFFHGIFLLLFVLVLVPVIKMVPMSCLAAMLIFVGFRLASPKTFFHAYKTGPEQLIVFLTTIAVTLFTDLLIGVFSGILVELIINFIIGLPVKNIFKPDVVIQQNNETYHVKLKGACTFSNWIPLNKKLLTIPNGKKVILDASDACLLDHTFMENIIHFKDEYQGDNGVLEIIGHEDMKRLAENEASALIRKVKTS